MIKTKARIGDLLVSRGMISREQLERALIYQATDPAPLGQILIQLRLLSESDLLAILAEQRGAQPWNLDRHPPEAAALHLIPPKVCREHRVLPVRVEGSGLVVAMVEPENLDLVDLLRAITKRPIRPVYALDTHLNHALNVFFQHAAQGERVQNWVDLALQERAEDQADQALVETKEDRPLVHLIDEILQEAVSLGASDIHFEPQRDRIDLRYRIDGQLRIARQLPKALSSQLVSRLKVMASVDLVEFRLPQDGRIETRYEGRPIDLRLNVLPSLHGPRLVMRILDRNIMFRDLDNVGMTMDQLRLYRQLIARPYGLILVTGPSGSGKTSTLYGTLSELKEFRGNVLTIEDPIEYEVEGISQSQINEKIGLTFASHIRAALRQDPDVILVGEIRDHETAEAAIRASLTGHLVLSTLHANDAPSAIARLLEMGIDPRVLSSSLIGVTAQRLVRTLCACAQADIADDSAQGMLEYMGAPPMTHVSQANGCPRCHLTGYTGRIGIHEVLPITGRVAESFAAKDPANAIARFARDFGFVSMQEQAIRLVQEQRTTLDEVLRVVAFDPLQRRARYVA